MIAGGISYYGLSDLIVVEGSINNFSYSQDLNFYKKNYDKLLKKNKKLIFEQDRATCHKSKKNMKLVNQLFQNNLLNAPSSPDIAYPIETLWAELKKNIMARNPKTKEDLKKYAIEEWNKIPLENIQNRFKHWRAKCQKIIDLEGNPLKDIHLKEIKEEYEENEENEEENEDDDENYKDDDELKLKIVYDEKEMMKKKKKEIKLIKLKINLKRNEKKRKEKQYNDKKASLKRRDLGSRFRYITNIEVLHLKQKINEIKEMDHRDYLDYFKKECEKKEASVGSTRTDSSINKILGKNIKISKIKKLEERFYSFNYQKK